MQTALTPHSTKLLENVNLVHGPKTLLGKFLLAAVDIAAARGLELELATIDDLVAANRANRDTWRPLASALDPTVCRVDTSNLVCLIGRNQDGEVVATQALKRFDWTKTHFEAEAQSLRLFYDAPADTKAPGESCTVAAPSARWITGRVAYAAGVWYHPKFRAGRLSTVLPRITRSIAYTLWDFDFVAGIIEEKTIASGFHERMGYTAVDWDVVRENAPAFQSEARRSRFGLVSMTADDFIDDIFSWLVGTDTEINRRIDMRSA